MVERDVLVSDFAPGRTSYSIGVDSDSACSIPSAMESESGSTSMTQSSLRTSVDPLSQATTRVPTDSASAMVMPNGSESEGETNRSARRSSRRVPPEGVPREVDPVFDGQ